MAPAVVQLSSLYARDAFGFVLGIDLALPGGTVGAFIGSAHDGTRALAEVLAGSMRPTSGRLTVGGHPPYDTPLIRRRIGALLDEPVWPDVGSVRQLMAVSRALRGEREDREPWFDALGLAELMKAPVRELDRRQTRTVALGLALSIPQAQLLVLYEPLADVVRADATMLRQLLRERAKEGTCVLVLTASPADAAALADDVATLQRGRIGRAIGAPDVDEMQPGASIEMRVWTDKPREVASALALDPSAETVWLSTAHKSAPVVVHVRDVQAGCQAVARIVAEQGAELLGLQTTMPSVAQVHDATLRLIVSDGGRR